MYKIPLYSKNPDFVGFEPFYDKAKDMNIWINNNKYLDMCHHLGTHLLGYSNNYINYHVKKCINKGNSSLLNHRYMEKLSNLMLGIHQWADSVRFCSSGGEAMYLAYELALEKIKHTKKPKIFFAGYFGWILKNIEKKNVEIMNFGVDGLNEIEKINGRPDILVFELLRHKYPKTEVVNKLNEWQKQGTILVLDEITSGFRLHCGGAHLLYNLTPDICVFSKAIGNGYPISIVIGKEKYMNSDLWISSTNWTDGIGFVAGYYTIKMLKHCNYYLLNKLGNSMFEIWKRLADKHNLNIKLGEVPNIANFDFIDKPLECKSLFVSEMQKEGILGHMQFYPTFKHKWVHLKEYMNTCDKVFDKIKKYLNGEKFEFKLLKELNK